MRKSLSIFFALVITFFTLPFGGISALADGKDYDDIKDGDYEITAKALHADKDEASGAAGFIEENAMLSIKDGIVELTITVPHNEMAEIAGLQIEGNEPTGKDGEDWTYKLDTLKQELVSQVQYEVPALNMEHDVPFRFMLEGLDELPEIEEEPEEPEEPKEPETPEGPGGSDESEEDKDESEEPEEDNGSNSEEESGSNGKEDEDSNGSKNEEELIGNADEKYEIKYVTDKSMIERYFDNPVTLLVKDGKKYIQINGNSANYITSLTINGEEVTWGNIKKDHTYTIQFEVKGSLSKELDFGMVIDTGNPNFGKMEHNVSLSFDVTTQKRLVVPSETITENNTQLTMPDSLPEDAKVTITPKKKIENKGDLEVVGDVLEFDFENLKDFKGNFKLVMDYDHKKYDSANYKVDIYYYDEAKDKWIAQGGTAKNGKVAVEVGHFSTYGIFAKKIETSEDTEKPVDTPDNAEEIDYTILHENGKDKSTANSFFNKPGLLFEKDGKQYVQVTINNGEMVKELSSEFGDAVIVKKHDDGSMDVQFRINDDLSDTLLEMNIAVPGLYNETHKAIFSINEDDQKTDPKEDPKKENPKGEKPKEKPKKESKDELLKPDKVYEIDYVIKHEDGNKESIANDFFKKPALLLEKDGKKYVQLTITNGDMVKDLQNKYGKALLVKENKDGSITVQMRVNDDLSDILLDMHITVPKGAFPGFPGYDEDHKAILSFNKDSMKEIPVGDHMLVGTSDSKNINGPTVEGADDNGGVGGKGDNTPKKPSFGNNVDKNGKTANGVGQKTTNPKTGDTSTILLYALLLVGSLIPLAVKLRRRFV